MSNYVLQLELGDGFNKADTALDSLLKKVGSLSTGQKMSFEDFISHDPTAGEEVGNKIGESVSKGVSKKLMSFNIFDAWGKSLSKFQMDMGRVWDDAVKIGAKGTTKPAGALGAFINQRHAESGKTVDKDFWTSMFPAIKGDKTLQQMIDQRHAPGGKEVDKDFWSKNFPPLIVRAPKNFNEENAGRNLAGIQSLPDVGKIQEDEAGAKKIDWKKILTGIGLGVSNPYIGSRVLSDELGKKLPAAGSGGGIAGGLFGKGGIAGFSEIFLAFKGFKIAVDLFKRTIEDARLMYSKALQNGMGLGFSVKRNALAEIMGVSETDIFRFGAQLAYLNPKLEFATSELAKTTKSLTELSYGLKITGYDFKALSAQFFDAMSPAINMIIDDFNSFLETLGKSEILKDIGEEFNVALIALGDVAGLIELIVNGFVTGLHVIADSMSIAIMSILNWISKLPGLHSLGGWDISKASKDLEESTGNLADEAKKVADNFFGKKTGALPSPSSWMKQLPASSWEKMGLGIMQTGQNYQKDIAKNTRDMAKDLKTIAMGFRGVGAGGSWGMSPVGNNP